MATGATTTRPASFTPAQRRRLLTLAIVATLVFIGLGSVVHTDLIFSIDREAQSFVQAERIPAFDGLMQAVTRIGSGWVLLPVTAVCCFAVGLRHRRLAWAFVFTALGAVLVEALSKVLVSRGRPNAYAWGYPSAHVLGAVVFFGMTLYLLRVLGVGVRQRALMTTIASVLVVGVALSRLWVNAHWLSDVIGGIAGGMAIVFTVAIAIDARGARAAEL
jgi:membrane-associated phospholipid phosphatase